MFPVNFQQIGVKVIINIGKILEILKVFLENHVFLANISSEILVKKNNFLRVLC